MNDILGGSAAARLFMNLREDKGYTYGAYRRISTADYKGYFMFNSEVRTPVTEGAMTEFFNEFKRIVNEPVPEQELQKSERSIVARFALSLESPSSLVGYALTTERYGFPADHWDKYTAQVMAVTAADVQRVARKYLNPDALQVLAVGDASTVRPVLARWGDVSFFGAEGKPQVAASAAAQ